MEWNVSDKVSLWHADTPAFDVLFQDTEYTLRFDNLYMSSQRDENALLENKEWALQKYHLEYKLSGVGLLWLLKKTVQESCIQDLD